MKTYFVLSLTILLIIFTVFQTTAQQEKWQGIWSGKLDISATKLEIIFETWNDENNNPTAVMDVPMQGTKDIQTTVLKADTDSLVLSVPMIFGIFKGEFLNDTTIKGEWKQSGMTFPLTLKKSEITTEPKRPQTPQKPYPYNEEEVFYENKGVGNQLAGTLTFPTNGENFPAVILITGSGAQDRDETIFEHKPFLVIADFLTRNGLAVYVLMTVELAALKEKPAKQQPRILQAMYWQELNF